MAHMVKVTTIDDKTSVLGNQCAYFYDCYNGEHHGSGLSEYVGR